MTKWLDHFLHKSSIVSVDSIDIMEFHANQSSIMSTLSVGNPPISEKISLSVQQGVNVIHQAKDKPLNVNTKQPLSEDIGIKTIPNKLAEDLMELYKERAAIIEFDGNLSREQAEREAFTEVMQYFAFNLTR